MFSKDLGLSQDLINAVAAITEASCSAKKMEKEELVGGQKKLDKNGNGKLDADDFKKLRKEDTVEEAKDGWSQNDSLAKPTTSGQAMANHSQYFTKVTKLDSNGNPKKPEKLRKEEAEELDELSKGTLANYSQKAAHDVGNKMYRAGSSHVTANVKKSEGMRGLGDYYDKDSAKQHSKALTRLQGIKTAAKKLAKEEFTLEDYSLEEIQDFMQTEDFEQLDELSKKTLGSYVKKATDDYTNRETRISRALDNSSKMFLDPNINKAAVKQANRKLGMNKAIDKLTKEQVEEIEMLAAKHGLGE
jgi:hypothetical protein